MALLCCIQTDCSNLNTTFQLQTYNTNYSFLAKRILIGILDAIQRIFLLIKYSYMKGKSVLQQPVNKNQAINHFTIKINKPVFNTVQNHNNSVSINNQYLPNIIKQEIKQIKARIQNSSKILSESRRQKHSPKKAVPSDSMPIRFNYQSAKTHSNNFDLYRLDERDSEQSDKDSQGAIQLPVHLEPQNKNYLNNDRIFKHKKQLTTQLQASNYKTERGLYFNEFTNSLEKIGLNKSVEYIKTARNNTNNELNKNAFKMQILVASNQQIVKKERQKSNINQSFTYRSKQKSGQKKKMAKTYNGKVKIKLNNPNKTPRTRNKTQVANYFTRPRYHIEFPQQKIDIKQKDVAAKREAFTNKSDWQKLKEQLQRYEFVRKYFSESELYQIYEYLRKNHINQQRWPLFVVDEAFKKMNMKNK